MNEVWKRQVKTFFKSQLGKSYYQIYFQKLNKNKKSIMKEYKCSGSVNSKLKDAFSGLRIFFATESPLNMMKNAFYSIIKSLFARKIFNFLS